MDIRKWLPNIVTLALAVLLVITQQVWAGPITARLTSTTTATSKTTINYQGYLTDSNGDPVNTENGPLEMVFRLYNVESGGTHLWTETQSVEVKDGLFSVSLGSVTSIPTAVVANNDNLWLGIAVGGDEEMSPREKIASSPYAILANIPDGSITSAKLANSAVTSAKIQDGQVSSADLASNAVTSAKIQDGEVGNADLANNAITSAKIQGGAVTPAKLNLSADVDLQGNFLTNAHGVRYTTAPHSGLALIAEGDGDDIRLVADKSITFFIDANNNSEDAAFRVEKNAGAWVSPHAEVFKVRESGYIDAHDTLDMHGNSIANLADGSISSNALANNAVTSAKIQDGAVTQSDAPSLVRATNGNSRKIQYGQGTISATYCEGTGYYCADITLPEPFQDTNYSVVVTPQHRPDLRVVSKTVGGFRVRSDIIGYHGFDWIAIGR